MSETERRGGIAGAGLVNLVAGATGALTGLALAAVVGRSLGTEGAGLFFVVVALFTICSNVAELGADTGLIRFVSAAAATGRLDTVRSLVAIAVRPVAAVGAGFVVVVGLLVAVGVVQTPVPGALVVVGAAVAVVSSMLAILLSLTRGFGDAITFPMLQNIVLPLLRLAAVALAVGFGTSAVQAVGAWLVPTLVVTVLAALLARRQLRRHTAALPRRQADLRAFWGFSAARGISSAVEIVLEWVDVLLVGALASAEAAGIYAVVTRSARAGDVVQQAARIAIGPQISGALASGDLPRARHIYGVVTAAMIWLSWPFYIVVAIFGDALLGLFGPGFEQGATALAVLVAAMAVATAAGAVQTILLMGGRSSWQLADKTGALVLNVVLNLALIPAWGIEGAAIAWAVTLVADTAVVVWQVQRLMAVRPHGTYLWVAAASSVVVVGGLSVAGRLVLGSSISAMVVTTAIAAVAYLLLSFALRHRLGLTRLSR